MGVDYRGHYGIGVELKNRSFEEVEIFDEDGIRVWGMGDYVYEYLPDSDEIYSFEVGEGMYVGGENAYYLCVKVPHLKNIDEQIEKLMQYIEDNDIQYIGEVKLCGGLEVS